jgi:predicted esterase
MRFAAAFFSVVALRNERKDHEDRIGAVSHMTNGKTRSAHRVKKPPHSVYVHRRIMVFGVLPLAVALSIYGIVASTGSPARVAVHHARIPTRKAAVPTNALEVGMRTISITDHSRKTYNYTTGKSEPGRTLGLEIRYPTRFGSAATETVNAKVDRLKSWPLVVFAPGYRLRAEDYVALLDDWVRSGFVVVATAFPDTTYPASEAPYKAGLPEGMTPEGDLYNQPGDVAFTLHELSLLDNTRSSWMRHLFDENKIALAGHSDGGVSVGALIYDAQYRVKNVAVGAVAVLSGGELPIANQTYSQPKSAATPLLVVQSATDLCNAPYEAVDLYNAVGPPKYFLGLDDATHLSSYNGEDAAATSVVAAVTTAFFEVELHIGHVDSSRILIAGSIAGVASATNVPIAASIPTAAGFGVCPIG